MEYALGEAWSSFACTLLLRSVVWKSEITEILYSFAPGEEKGHMHNTKLQGRTKDGDHRKKLLLVIQRSGCSLNVYNSKRDTEHRSPGKQIFSAERSPCDQKAANLHKRQLPT